MSNYLPTSEQQQIIDAFEAGFDVVAAAGAGTGKTSTLVFLAQAAGQRRGLYVAFNKAIQLEAEEKFRGTNCQAKTIHALAYGWMIRNGLKPRFNEPKPDWKATRAFVGAKDYAVNAQHTVPAKVVLSAVKQAHTHYCDSADETLNIKHVRRALPPLPEGVDSHSFSNYVLNLAKRYSADALSENGTMNFGFNEMLKRYQLSHPQLRIDYIVFDEAQDANPVITDIISRQNCQKVYVGDENQQIYEWRGAINAMGDFARQEGVKTFGLTQSFRFGEAIAEIANEFLTALSSTINGQPFRLSGFDQIESKVGALDNPDAVLCRSNGGCLTEAMAYLQEGKKVAIVGGGKDLKAFAFGARDLQLDPKDQGGQGSNHPELVAFNNWEEVIEYVESGEADSNFSSLVKLISNWGVGCILKILGGLTDEENADVVISTVHKAKGREWDRVRIADDFHAPEKGNEASPGELRTAYVAVTRAKKELEKGGLNWISAYLIDQGLVEVSS